MADIAQPHFVLTAAQIAGQGTVNAGACLGNMLTVYSTLDAPVLVGVPVADGCGSAPLLVPPGACVILPVGPSSGTITVKEVTSPVPTVGSLWGQSWCAAV